MEKIVKASQEVRIHRRELYEALGHQYDFLWAFARKRCRCSECSEAPEPLRPYRIYVNGFGDFSLYNYCGTCDQPTHHHMEMSEEPEISARIQNLWLSYHN
jgi:hypothetical protein